MEHTLHRILEHHQIAQFTITLAPGNNKLITPRSPNIFPFGVRALITTTRSCLSLLNIVN